jgi:putative chitinase
LSIDKKYFFDTLRKSLFSKGYTNGQVEGLDAILDGFDYANDLRWLAYMLATAFHETARTMQPIHEYGSDAYLAKYDTGRLAKMLGNTPEADGDGQLYCGRGFVQATGRTNYKRASDELGVDLIAHPDLAMEPKIAMAIMQKGMVEGWFTGKKLANYFNKDANDPVGARRIINGTDQAQRIAGYFLEFGKALKAA